jgi:hypothetical protein
MIVVAQLHTTQLVIQGGCVRQWQHQMESTSMPSNVWHDFLRNERAMREADVSEIESHFNAHIKARLQV